MNENSDNNQVFTADDILKMDQRYGINLINTLTGLKSINLIATQNEQNNSNLAIFNSLIHIGARPPYLGFIMRPLTVERHTYENIKQLKYFTVNQVHKDIFEKAHHSSAKYPKTVSEFEKCNLTAFSDPDFPIPFVTESKIKIACSFVEEHPIKANGTLLIVAQILKIIIDPSLIKDTGHVDHAKAKTIAISGLDEYYDSNYIKTLEFARPRVEE